MEGISRGEVSPGWKGCFRQYSPLPLPCLLSSQSLEFPALALAPLRLLPCPPWAQASLMEPTGQLLRAPLIRGFDS